MSLFKVLSLCGAIFIFISGANHSWCQNAEAPGELRPIVVSENHRFLATTDGEPFFWLGDTAWLLFHKLSREEAESYLENRRVKEFNVVQAVAVHHLPGSNFYGDSPFVDDDPLQPNVTEGSDPASDLQYDYWDHVDYIVDLAARKGIYVGMLPVWGSLVKGGHLDVRGAVGYAEFLAARYGDRANIIWISGGDVQGDVQPEVWQALGETLYRKVPGQLVTFHPFGRTQSSTWFHFDEWLDFNMFQSGHRRYDQRRESDDPLAWKGEDNWKYVLEDYALVPPKPTVDGEPSYENIPQGLHDPSEPYWEDRDVRRYAYWAVFAGAFGHTYGNNAVMQMHKPGSGRGAYGVRNYWYEAVDEPGAAQMQHLKALVLSRPFFERVYDPYLIAGGNGTEYERVLGTHGESYAFLYTYTGRTFRVSMGRITGETVKAWWFNPRNGEASLLGEFPNAGVQEFDPPGSREEGNDWVLVLEDASFGFPTPGR